MEYNEELKLWQSKYWHPALATDAVVLGFDGQDLHILLIKRGRDPFEGNWALPGGFMIQTDRNAKECMLRELHEETNVSDIYLEELFTSSEIDRDPRERVISTAFFALVVKNRYKVKGGDDAKLARWFLLKDLERIELAFDHKEIIKKAMERLRQRIHFEPIGFHLLDREFTMPQLQNIYLSILDPDRENEKLQDRRNFTKKMLHLGYVKDTGRVLTGNPHKSPKLYTFDEEAYQNAKKIGMRLEF